MTAFALHMIGMGHTLYATVFGAGIWCWLRWIGNEATAAHALVCSLPALLCLALTFTTVADQQQYIVRLMAGGMFTPILLWMWCISVGGPALPRWPWLYGAGAILVHVAAFCGSVLWLSTNTTRIAPEPDVAAVGVEVLGARLRSLNAIGGPLDVISTAANEVSASYRYRAPDRSYRIVLNFDPQLHRVRVRERASAEMAKPATASERSLRRVGDPLVDAARPEASRISEFVVQVTPVNAEQLKIIPISFRGEAVDVPPGYAAELDEKAVLTLICAVSTRSGWEWRPAFFGAE